jgi:hypothetical protein
MHHQLGHGGRVTRQVQVPEDVIPVSGEQVFGAVVRQFAQNLIADGRDAVNCGRGGDELADRALVLIGQTGAPAY